MKESEIKIIIKEILINLGADVCGIAAADSFTEAPEGFRPSDIYANCRSVIVFGKAMPKGTVKVSPRIIYQHFNSLNAAELDRITYNASVEIERQFNCIAVPVPSDGPYEYWDAEKTEGRGIISMKHAAVLAGIGTLGKNTLLMNDKYGNMLNIGAVLTDLSLQPDPPAEKICLKGCRKCIESCPACAISDNGVDQLLCRKYTYGKNARSFDIVNCNKCRTVCPLAFGKIDSK
jgi:epoxyqueuosine reductase QueG